MVNASPYSNQWSIYSRNNSSNPKDSLGLKAASMTFPTSTIEYKGALTFSKFILIDTSLLSHCGLLLVYIRFYVIHWIGIVTFLMVWYFPHSSKHPFTW